MNLNYLNVHSDYRHRKLVDIGLTASLRGAITVFRRLVQSTPELTISDVHLQNPTLVQRYSGQIGDQAYLPMRFNISFRISCNEEVLMDECRYAVIVEYESEDATQNTITQNFSSSLDFHGLSEPQIAPLILFTDFHEFVELIDENGDLNVTRESFTDMEIKIRVATNMESVAGDTYTTTIESLIHEWVQECHGMDLRDFANTTDEELMSYLESLPERPVDDDLLT